MGIAHGMIIFDPCCLFDAVITKSDGGGIDVCLVHVFTVAGGVVMMQHLWPIVHPFGVVKVPSLETPGIVSGSNPYMWAK